MLLSEDDFDKFVPGSILVTIETSSVWTPLFSIAKAVVTDVGGILSHSAILGREYGLPVISGCVEGTKKLKTGMKVRQMRLSLSMKKLLCWIVWIFSINVCVARLKRFLNFPIG